MNFIDNDTWTANMSLRLINDLTELEYNYFIPVNMLQLHTLLMLCKCNCLNLYLFLING